MTKGLFFKQTTPIKSNKIIKNLRIYIAVQCQLLVLKERQFIYFMFGIYICGDRDRILKIKTPFF